MGGWGMSGTRDKGQGLAEALVTPLSCHPGTLKRSVAAPHKAYEAQGHGRIAVL